MDKSASYLPCILELTKIKWVYDSEVSPFNL